MKIIVFNRMMAENPELEIHEPHIMVSVTDPNDSADIPDRPTCKGVLRVRFHDSYRFGPTGGKRIVFSREQARRIIDFVMGSRAKVPYLIVHCFAGMNRSPAIAAALARIMGQDDEVFFKKHEPDSWVYRTMLDVFYEGRTRHRRARHG